MGQKNVKKFSSWKLLSGKGLSEQITEMKLDVSGKKIRFAGFEVDFARREIRRRGMRVRLQHKPFQILELLLRCPGALVTREEMARHLWPDSHVSVEHGLNTAVNALRHALGDSSHSARFIETRAGLGYCFVASAEEVPEPGEPATNNNTHQDCLKGHYFLDKMTEECTRKGIAYFESALSECGQSAAPYAGLSDGWCELARLSMIPPRDAGMKAKEFAILALSCDSRAAVAHVAIARVKWLFDGDVKCARAEFTRALELDAKSAAAHACYASFLSAMEDPHSALKHARTAQSIEPLSLRIGVEHAWLLYANRLFEAAAEQCWKVLALESRVWMAQLVLGLAYRELGMSGEAIAEAHNAVICSGRNPLALAALGCLSNGDSAEILIELQELSQIRYVNPLSFALVYAGMKQPEAALQWTRRAFTEQDIHLHWLKQSPLLEPFLEPITSHKRE